MALTHKLVITLFLVCSFACFAVRSQQNVNDRLSCILTDSKITDEECTSRGCIVDHEHAQHGVPWCYLNTKSIGYTASQPVTRANGIDAHLSLKPDSRKATHFEQIAKLAISVNYLSDHILRIKITDADKKRYEVPVQANFHLPTGQTTKPQYHVELHEGFNLTVARKDTGVKIIDTSIGGLIYSDRFIQFVTHLGSKDIYGMGENFHLHFKHDLNFKTYPVFARDKPIGDVNSNAYGTQPFFTVVEHDGKSHGILLLNSNAMAYTLMPSPAISLKTTGGILDLFIFVGDNPEHVIELYTSVIGRPVMPPFWGLGFQLCRYGYKDMDHLKMVLKRTFDHNVPLDVSYLDIDYMDEYRDFTYSKTHFASLPEYVQETKAKQHLRWAFIIDPAIQADKQGYHAFDDGYKRDVFIKWPTEVKLADRHNPAHVPTDKAVMYGKVWPKGPAAFPDFLKNETVHWWKDMIKGLHKELAFDALWIDMNEPSNFHSNILKCPVDHHFDFALPEQKFRDNLTTQTLCLNAIQGEQGEYRHFDVHSLYGLSETIPTQVGVQEATGKRGFVLTRSTYPSSGKYSAHWLGDNSARWDHMRQSVIGMLEFSLFGATYTGADICGFMGNTTPELCRRWFQLGAYYPFSRSHNDLHNSDQDPGFWADHGHPEVTKAAVDSLRTRYQLLHYLYTRFYRSHVTGETLARPMHHVYPQDEHVRGIDQQFFLGPHILVAPFLHENQHSVNATVPSGTEWYKMALDFVEKVNPTAAGHIEISDAESHRPLLFRARSIVPVVAEHNLPKVINTAILRTVPIELWILPTANGTAHGDLFFDDGESVDTVQKGHYNYYEFTFDKCHLTIDVKHHGYQAPSGSKDVLKISSINVAVPNLKHQDLQATLNGTHLKSTITGHTFKIETNIDLLTTNKSVTISMLSTSNECIY